MLDEILNAIQQGGEAVAYTLLMAATFIEYVVPPLPGDTVALFGVFLATQAALNLWLVFVAMTLGAALGGCVAWAFGIWLADRETRWPRWLQHERTRAGLTRVRAGYARFGPWYLLANRFLPAFRAFFFVGAGLSRMSLAAVLLYGTLSAALWNGLLIAVGYAVGSNWDRLNALAQTYASTAIVVVGVAVLAGWLVRRVGHDGGSK